LVCYIFFLNLPFVLISCKSIFILGCSQLYKYRTVLYNLDLDRNGSLRPDFTSGFIGAIVDGRAEAELRTTGLAFQKIDKT